MGLWISKVGKVRFDNRKNNRFDVPTSLPSIADPGHAKALPVTQSYNMELTIGSSGAETNTLAAPTFINQTISIIASVVGTGTRAITAAAINQSANTHMTFAAVRDWIKLEAFKYVGVLTWRVIANDGVALS